MLWQKVLTKQKKMAEITGQVQKAMKLAEGIDALIATSTETTPDPLSLLEKLKSFEDVTQNIKLLEEGADTEAKDKEKLATWIDQRVHSSADFQKALMAIKGHVSAEFQLTDSMNLEARAALYKGHAPTSPKETSQVFLTRCYLVA